MIFQQIYLTQGITTLDQNEPESNGNEEVLYSSQISRTGTSPSDTVSCYT